MKKYFNNNLHCCLFMDKFLEDSRIGIYYSSIFRSYKIFIPSSGAYQGIYNCPWCGFELPKNLNDIYDEVLKKEYNIDDPWDKDQEKYIPKEFESDEWWKKRGL